MNKKVTELTEVTEIKDEDLLMVIQSGENKKVTAGKISNLLQDNLTIVTPTEPTGDNREKVWIQKGKNILIPSNGSTAISNNDNNTYTFKSDLDIDWYSCIAMAKLEANTQYTISASSALGYGRIGLSTNKDKIPDEAMPDIQGEITGILNTTKNSTTFISNKEQTVYLKYCSDEARADLSAFTVSIQLEQGSEATEYEPYIEKRIFVKNDNGVYEEFVNVDKINKNTEEIDKLKTYSTEEQVIGTWIDGRPLYRKTIICGALPNATSSNVETGLDSSCKVVKMYGYSQNPYENALYVPLPYASPTNANGIGINMYKNQIVISTGMDRSKYTETCVTLEYIKATD